MAKGNQAPTTIAEGLNSIHMAVSAAMTATDIQPPQMQLLQQLQKAVLGAMKAPPGGGQGAPAGGPPGAAGGGTNLAQLGGAGPSAPSAGPQGPPSSSGASPEDVRRLTAASAGMPS